MKRYVMALALFGCLAGVAQADYLIIRVNLGIPPLPPKQKPKAGPGGFVAGPGGVRMIPRQPQQPTGRVKGPPAIAGGKKGEPLTLVVFVEYDKPKKIGKDEKTDTTYTRIQHQWGKTYLAFDQHIVHITAIRKKEGVGKMYKARHEDAYHPGNRTPRKFFELAEWALVHNVLEDKAVKGIRRGLEFFNVMNDLVKMNAKTPVAEPDIKAALKAYQQVKAELQAPIDKDDAAVSKKSLGMGQIMRSSHYALLYDSDGGKAPEEVTNRRDLLERNYQQFFYWFALRGKVLPVPPKKLLAVLIDSPQEFRKQYVAFDAPPIITDGFYARRENIVFFSGNRLDGPSDAFDKHRADLVRNGWDFKQLLKGQLRRDKTPQEIAYAQTMALVHKSLQEESEIASVSHEGTRQLLTATGILPRGVALPNWVHFGLPSVFETPKYDPFTRTGAFYPMFAGPSWTYLVNFKLMDMEQKLDKKPEQLSLLLRDVIADGPFYRAARTRQAMDFLHARTMAWSLSYYLAQRNLDGLLRYCRELAQLPRDLDFDTQVYFQCFARAFHLEDPKQPGGVDPAKLQQLAADWYKFIAQTTPLPMKETLDEAQKALQEYREKNK